MHRVQVATHRKGDDMKADAIERQHVAAATELTVAEHEAALHAELLDDILCRWHHWQQGYRGARGWSGKSLVAGDYRVSRQYDDANGALDSDIEASIMKDVDFQVTEMIDPYRTAVYVLARNLSTGVAVFSSPRLPVERIALAEVMRMARALLLTRLIAAGVV